MSVCTQYNEVSLQYGIEVELLCIECMCMCTWQRCDEVPLEHGLEVGVDVSVLVVAHARDEVLHKLHLVPLRPLVKQLDAHVLLLLKVALRRPLPGARHDSVTELSKGRHREQGVTQLHCFKDECPKTLVTSTKAQSHNTWYIYHTVHRHVCLHTQTHTNTDETLTLNTVVFFGESSSE